MSLWTLGATTVLRGGPRSPAALDATTPTQPSTPTATALASLAKYIPGETTTAFLAVLGLAGGIDLPANLLPQLKWVLYALCAVLTPALVFLSARATWNSNKAQAAPFAPPIWRMVAATVAFLIWALAVPGLIPQKGFAALAAIGAILISPLFVYLEKAFGFDD